jgi:ATP-dependent RNA helicase HelY
MNRHSHHRRHSQIQSNSSNSERYKNGLSENNDDDSGLSPAQRYAAFRDRQSYEGTLAARFAQSLPFGLDSFQVEANKALEDGHNVLVAAPTGAGKTVIADFAMYLAQDQNVKAFYTTPIKALSNQK